MAAAVANSIDADMTMFQGCSRACEDRNLLSAVYRLCLIQDAHYQRASHHFDFVGSQSELPWQVENRIADVLIEHVALLPSTVRDRCNTVQGSSKCVRPSISQRIGYYAMLCHLTLTERACRLSLFPLYFSQNFIAVFAVSMVTSAQIPQSFVSVFIILAFNSWPTTMHPCPLQVLGSRPRLTSPSAPSSCCGLLPAWQSGR